MEPYPHLRKPIQIGNLRLKHRIVMGPMWTRLAGINGEVTQQMIDYYVARAKSGPEMVVIESTAVDSRYGWTEPTLRLDGNQFQPWYHKLVEAIHLNGNGVPVLGQLIHVGAFSDNPVSPSGVPSMKLGGTGLFQPRVLSIEEIEETREKFIEAAVRVKEVGCDGVLVHGATAYLLEQFVSPYTNKRTDKYGGSLENRMRLPLEIVRGIREKCGPDFVLGYVMVAHEWLPDGITFEESVPFAKALEEASCDYLDMFVGTYETFASDERSPGHSKYTKFGLWPHTDVIKKALKIPVVHRTHGDYDPDSWEKHLEEGHADIVQLAKPTLCDPGIFNKVLEGKREEVRFCTRCHHCHDEGIIGHNQVECALNPETGREREYAISPASKAKKVLIIGGGPGGLEAARVAALRGHDVTLMEKEADLGGKMRFLALCEANESYGVFRDWLVLQCTKAGVKFNLNAEATPQAVKAAGADVVVLAMGAPDRITPDIPGISMPHVFTPEEVLTKKAAVGKSVVVIGGNRIGVDLAYTMMKRQLAEKVTIIEEQAVNSVGYDMEVLNMAIMAMILLPKLGVQALTGAHVEKITADVVHVVDPEGRKQKIPADTVIFSAGYRPVTTLFDALQGQVKELHSVGDCVKFRNVRYAVHEAAFWARQF